ncbi:MAG: hypothetical protein PHP54_00395 [Clostridia bacterium]|nr:hypothetical protein [Clostridia bacterium]
MNCLYVYTKNTNIDNVTKYGMKLSEFADKFLFISGNEKAGITAFLSPKDSELYFDNDYTCLKILIDSINIYVYNKYCENSNYPDYFLTKYDNYHFGDYEEPMAFICSTILPENISVYNKIKDTPLIIQNSKDYFYEKSINDMLENDKFTKYELYQILLILGEQKRIFSVEQIENIKLYKDKINGKLYTKRSNF